MSHHFATPQADGEAMTVTVRDRSAEKPWGTGLLRVALRRITIPAVCPHDSQRRGEPRQMHQCEEGVHYWVDVWSNPCGHTDYYPAVIAEAQERGSLGAVVYR